MVPYRSPSSSPPPDHRAILSSLSHAQRSIANSAPGVPPFTAHGLYPDRYRPSGIGDNTRLKRKRNWVPVRCPPPQKELRFNLVPSLMQKGGTKENPLELIDSDYEDGDKKEDNFDQETGQSMLANSKAKRRKITHPRVADEIINAELYNVKQEMGGTARQAQSAQDRMKMMFDRFGDRFVSDSTETGINHLKGLAAAMRRVAEAAKDGLASIEGAMRWLGQTRGANL